MTEGEPTPLLVEDVQTERLTLTALSLSHSAGMYRLWSHPDVVRYSGKVTDYDRTEIAMPASAPAESDKIIDFWRRAAADGWGFRWAVVERASNAFVGHIGFNSLGANSEIAYHLSPDHWGKGIMSEAGRAAIDWVLINNPDTVLEAFIEDANAGSIALITRLGFKATGTFNEGAQCYRRP